MVRSAASRRPTLSSTALTMPGRTTSASSSQSLYTRLGSRYVCSASQISVVNLGLVAKTSNQVTTVGFLCVAWWSLVRGVGSCEAELEEPRRGGVESAQQGGGLPLPQDGAVLSSALVANLLPPPQVVSGADRRVHLVLPGVVVRLLRQLTEESVEAAAGGKVSGAAVAEVPLAHQVGGVARVLKQSRQGGQLGRALASGPCAKYSYHSSTFCMKHQYFKVP